MGSTCLVPKVLCVCACVRACVRACLVKMYFIIRLIIFMECQCFVYKEMCEQIASDPNDPPGVKTVAPSSGSHRDIPASMLMTNSRGNSGSESSRGKPRQVRDKDITDVFGTITASRCTSVKVINLLCFSITENALPDISPSGVWRHRHPSERVVLPR